MVIWQIMTQINSEAPRYGVDPSTLIGRLVYGVGTRLITSQGDPALGGVYKEVAYREADGQRVMAKTFGRTLTPAQLRTSLHFCSRAGKEPLGVA